MAVAYENVLRPSVPGLAVEPRPSMNPPAAFGHPGRWMTVAACVALACCMWGGFEVHDEAVGRPAPRPVRFTSVTADGGVGGIEYVEGLDAGLRRAVADDKPMLVIFRAGWCRWCAELAQGTLADRRLVALSRHFVCVVVDADRHTADCRRWGVKEFPTVLVTSPDGGEHRRWTGCPDADELIAVMSGRLPTSRLAATPGGDADAIR